MAGAPKAPAPVSAAAIPTPSAGVEEGEVLVGETLLSLRGGDIPGGSSAPPADKELEMLEGLNFDEPGKLRYFILRGSLVCLRPEGPLFVVFAVVSASMQQLLAVMHGPGTSGILPPEKGKAGPDCIWLLFNFLCPRR